MSGWGGYNGSTDTKQLFTVGLLAVAVVAFLATPVTAQTTTVSKQQAKNQLKDQMGRVGNFLAIVIGAVAIPNGAFGVFQYMTAGTDSEQSDKGRKRIRNSFIGVAGATAVVTAVKLLGAII